MKTLYELEKKGLKTTILFDVNHEMDSDDDWFIDIKRKYKNGRVDILSTIVKPDLDNRLRSYKNDGWLEKK
jgi:hypothetical protein